MNSRRNFLKLAGAGVVAAGIAPVAGFSTENQQEPKYIYRKADPFSLGIAGYTFYKLSFEKAAEIMKRVNVMNLSLKDNFLPMNSTAETIASVIDKFKSAGINVYTLGVIYLAKAEEVENAFTYAKAAGVKMIVAAPNVDMLPLVVMKIKETGIRVAIHNHGPDNTLFPTAKDIWNHIKDLDPGIGICLDIGHTKRAGQDPAVDVVRYASRIFDIHIKDVTADTKEGKTIEMGRGVIDIPGFVAALRKSRYKGMCSLEFEKDMDDPIAGIAESIGYFKGVLRGEK